MEVKSETTLKGPWFTKAGHRAGSTGCALGVVIVASVAEEMLLDFDCELHL